MSNVLNPEKQQQVIALARLGWSLRRIQAETGVRRETASRYVREAGVSVRRPGQWGRGKAKAAIEVITEAGSKAAIEVITDPDPPKPAQGASGSACEAHREFIETNLSLGRNAMAIWQDLVTDHGFEAQYASVSRFVRKLRGQQGPAAKAVITTAPGEEAQVDYGEGPMVRDPDTGKYRRTRLFAMTLGCSRKTVWLLTFKSSSRIWCELHERSFRRLGGVPKVVVLDNLKEGVLKPDIYDAALNPLYRDMLAHYDVVAMPCRPYHPDRKGKVESAIGHAQGTALKGLRFDLLEDAQAHLDSWTERWADTRIHGTTKRQVSTMFAEEKPYLASLPVTPFRYYEYGKRKVHLDGCVEVKRAYYAVPPGRISDEVNVQWDEHRVRILDRKTGTLLREHAKAHPGTRRFNPDDYPDRTPPSTVRLLERANTAGKNIGTVCKHIHDHDGEYGLRRIMGVLSLAKKFGVPLTEDACESALHVGTPSYQFIKRYLNRPQPHLSVRQVDPLIRELFRYRDLVNELAEGVTS